MLKQRLKKLQAQISHPILIKKKENLFYLTGRSFMHGYLLVAPRKDAEFNAERRRKSSVVFFGDGLEKVEGMKADRLKNIPFYLSKSAKLELEDQFTFAEYNYIKNKIKDSQLKIKVAHVRSPVDYQRQIKEPGERALIKKSMQIVEAVFKLVRKEIKKPGMTEVKLAKFIESSGMKLGADDISFPAIVASGNNAAVPHHVPSNKKLKPGESIILDFGFKYKNYCSDFTRTVFLKKVHPKLETAYNQVEKAYNESINLFAQYHPLTPSYIRRGNSPSFQKRGQGGDITGNDVYQKAVNILAEKKLDKYFIHSLGHGTGLEIHELPNLSPNSKDVISDGMVFSIEPGVYIPKLGGIRIEDLVYLQKGIPHKFIQVPTNLGSCII